MCGLKAGDEVAITDDDGGALGLQYRLWLNVFHPDAPGFGLKTGATFIVRDVKLHPHINDLFGIDIDGTGVYPHYIFRKVQRRDLTAWLATENTISNPNPIRHRERETA